MCLFWTCFWQTLLFPISWRDAFYANEHVLRNQTFRVRFDHSNLILSSIVIGTGWQVARGLLCKKAGEIWFSLCVRLHSCIDRYHLCTTRLLYISVPSPQPSLWSIRYGTGLFMRLQWSCRVAEINEACFCGWQALMACLYCCTCSLMLLTSGYTRVSYTLPGHNSARKENQRVYVLHNFSTSFRVALCSVLWCCFLLILMKLISLSLCSYG